MAEIDPVILDLRADLAKYQADMRKQAADTERQLGRSERAVQRLEKQMLKSSTAISGSLRTIGATLGTYFSGRELVGLIDGFTRLQNNLKVAGLEGQNLEQVQSRLLDLSTRYGVSIESLADLFGKATQAGRDLGASQEQLLSLTEATSQALLITGTSSQQASGAILGLTQALASGTVRAEEFNQINEGGLSPLLQAAAASEKYGGSIAKLRIAVNDGKVSSQEFYQAILSGSQQLESQAAKATLTVAGAFEALTSRLTVYIGQAAQTSGATAALAGAMQLLADNLDTIIPLLAIIGAALAGRFLAGAIAGSAALRSLAAYASIATTSLAGTSLAAQSAGAALLKAFGGPVGLAVTGLTLAIGALAYATRDTAASLGELQAGADAAQSRLLDAQNQAKKAGVNIDALKRSSDGAKSSFFELATALRLSANAMAEVSKNAKLAALATIQLENAKARSAVNEISPRVDALDSAASRNRRLNALLGQRVSGFQDLSQGDRDRLEVDRARLAVAKQTLATNRESAALIRAIPEGQYVNPNAPAAVAGAAASDDKKKKKVRTGTSGPSAAEIEDRFQSELFSIAQQTISARQALATSAEDRAELELRSVELARVAALESLKADKDYNAAQKARVADAIENLAEIERERIQREKRIQQFEEATDAAEQQNRYAQDALQRQFDLATTEDERRRIALLILDAEDAFLRSKLDAVIANEDLAEAVRAQARIELAALNSSSADRRKLVEKSSQGALGRYIDSISDTKARAEEATVRQLEAVNQGITDALTDGLGIKNQLVKDLFSIFLDEVIFRPLAEAMRDSQSGGGGVFSAVATAIGSLFGRASGGFVAPGQMVRVNESAAPGRVEGFRPTGSGMIIPLGQMNARAAGTAPVIKVVSSPQFDLRGTVMTPQLYADMERIARANAVEAGASAYSQAMKDAPGAMASAQRYGG